MLLKGTKTQNIEYIKTLPHKLANTIADLQTIDIMTKKVFSKGLWTNLVELKYDWSRTKQGMGETARRFS